MVSGGNRLAGEPVGTESDQKRCGRGKEEQSPGELRRSKEFINSSLKVYPLK